MLARCAWTVWAAWLGAMVLATVWTALGVWNPNPILPIGLASLMAAAGIGLVIAAAVRLVRGPRRVPALAGLLAGTAPFWFLAGHVLMAMRPAFDRHVAPRWPTKVMEPLARPLVDLEACWFYPERTPGTWVTMVGTKAADAPAQVAAMDRHVAAVMDRLGESSTWPITWYRGSLLGLQNCSIHDTAFGTPVGLYLRGADGLTETDRHEVAHCVIARHCTTRSDPPRVLMEGWAQANQGTPAEALACVARDDRRRGLSPSLRQLVAPDWYWYSGTAAYNQGGPLVNYLLRTYGSERFLKLYTTCQQATFEADCRTILGVGLDELEAAVRADTEQIVERAGPATRVWMKGFKLAPGIDPAAWDAFLADYFAAAGRVLAPYEHIRLATVLHRHGGGRPSEQRQELLRSGPMVRLRKTGNWDDLAYLAHPDHSIQARRRLRPKAGPWEVVESSPTSREQDYERTLERIAFQSTMAEEPAMHGGMILVGQLGQSRDVGYSDDYEVAQLDTTIAEGRRLVTLRVRTSPAVKGDNREDFTFVLDADDSFAARSERVRISGRLSGGQGEFEIRYEYDYDHQDDLPMFRGFTTTIGDPTAIKTVARLEVTDRRFGPIPDSEFAPEPFLAGLAPDGIIRRPAEDDPTAALLSWYWLAFASGGISLVAGSILRCSDLASHGFHGQAPA